MGDLMTTKKSVRGILVAGEFPAGTDGGSARRSQSAIEEVTAFGSLLNRSEISDLCWLTQSGHHSLGQHLSCGA